MRVVSSYCVCFYHLLRAIEPGVIDLEEPPLAVVRLEGDGEGPRLAHAVTDQEGPAYVVIFMEMSVGESRSLAFIMLF